MAENVNESDWKSFFKECGIPDEQCSIYSEKFVKNRIQSRMVTLLTNQHLYDMGIEAVGDVLAILNHAKKGKALESDKKQSTACMISIQEKELSYFGKGQKKIKFAPDGRLELEDMDEEERTAFQPSDNSDLCEKAKIYGRISEKPLTKYQMAVNEAAMTIAKENPIVVLDRGNLMNKAKLKVMSDGYQYVKGKSRSKSGSETDSKSPANKRAKFSSEERCREIKLLQENTATLNSRLSFKRQQLEKERCINNYKQCDTISGEMMEIRKELASVDSQLSALVKKEAKSVWYHKKKTNNKKVANKNKRGKVGDNQTKLLGLLKKSSPTSSTDDTVILSDSSVENVRDSPSSFDENMVISSEEKQNFQESPPKNITNQAEGIQHI